MSTPSSTPPGWYADPAYPGSSRQRWWSGLGWTEHVADPQQAPEPQQASGKKPSRPPIENYPALKYVAEHKGLAIASLVFAVLPAVILIFTNTLGWLTLGFVLAVVSLVLDAVMTAGRRRVQSVSVGNVVVLFGLHAVVIGILVWGIVQGIETFLQHR